MAFSAVAAKDRVKELLSEAYRFFINSASAQAAPAGEVVLNYKTDHFEVVDENGAVIATLMNESSQSVNPAADSGAGSSITAGVRAVDVGAVVNDANDWIVLPPIADVEIGHEITIACNAGTNFEMRTPAASGTKINDVDSDGTQEYLCTDTDIITVKKATTTGWVAVSETKLGARRAAVVPD